MDLGYPGQLHDRYPLVPDKKAIKMSSCRASKMSKVDLNLDPPNSEKLVLTLEDKEKYVVHHKNLQMYLRPGMHMKKVHMAIEFDQEPTSLS